MSRNVSAHQPAAQYGSVNVGGETGGAPGTDTTVLLVHQAVPLGLTRVGDTDVARVGPGQVAVGFAFFSSLAMGGSIGVLHQAMFEYPILFAVPAGLFLLVMIALALCKTTIVTFDRTPSRVGNTTYRAVTVETYRCMRCLCCRRITKTKTSDIRVTVAGRKDTAPILNRRIVIQGTVPGVGDFALHRGQVQDADSELSVWNHYIAN